MKKVLLVSILFMTVIKASAQISGQTSVCPGQTYTYTVTSPGGGIGSGFYIWTLNGVRVPVSRNSPSIANITMPTTGISHTLSVTVDITGEPSQTYYLTLVTPFAGNASIESSPTVCYNGGAQIAVNLQNLGYGGTGNFQKRTGTAWIDLSNTGTPIYVNNLTSDTDFRYKVSNSCGTLYSNIVTVNVNPALNPGSINGTKTICYNSSAGTLGNASSPTGGDNSYSYQWQVSTSSGGSYSNISGANAASYSPGNLSATRYYRRRVVSCGETKYTNAVAVTVRPALSPGSVTGTKTICYNSPAGTLGNASSPTGGDNSYSYQWQVSTSIGGTYNDISGANAATYSAGNLTATRYYRRRVISCGETKYSNIVSVTVRPTLSPGSINGTKFICYNTSAGTLGHASSATGGDNNYTYQWQVSSSSGGTYSNITGATSTTYNPGNLTATSFYRRRVTSCGETKYSNVVTITVDIYIQVSAGNTFSIYQFEGNRSLVNTGESPSGGAFSGGYVSNNTFNAAQSDPGSKTITYTYTNGNGCSAFATKNITVLANPTMSVQGGNEIVWGENKVLTVPSGFSSYQWHKNGASISGGTSRSYTVTHPGTYYVRITAASGASLNVSPANIINKASQQNENFVQIISYKTAKKEGEAVSTIGEVMEHFTYYDGLGRPMQTLQTQASPNRRDMIKPIAYDELGRVNKEYLPYAANKNDGVLDPSALRTTGGSYETSNQFGFYDGTESTVAATNYPYAEVSYEPSPLNRPIAQYAPGEDWAKESGNKPVTTDYLISTAADNVKRFIIVNGQLTKSTPYGNGAFEKLLVTDENGNQSATFTDAFGKTLLKRNYGEGTDQFDTYYVYDIFDNLRFVIPPEASWQIIGTLGAVDSNLLEQFAFQYQYDDRQRMEWKKVPGAEPVIMVYDDRNRLVLTQDGEQRKDSLFSFTKYDVQNRPIMTGETEIVYSLDSIRNRLVRGKEKVVGGQQFLDELYEVYSNSHHLYGYTNNSYPSVSEAEIYTITYYDNYDFRTAAGMDGSTYNYSTNGVTNEFAQNNLVKGQVTGSLTRVLGTAEMLGSINYYDERYRLVQSISQQPDGKFITANNGYDFIGNLKKAKTIYSIGADTQTITETFTHDHADRLMTVTHQVNQENPVLMVSNEYNELGELITKSLHEEAGAFAQSVDYRYNIRGWLERINHADLSADHANEASDLFGMELGYTDNLGMGSDAQYNGNIAAIKWGGKRNDMTEAETILQNAYGYAYDPLNRITEANYFEGPAQTTSQKYQLRVNEYDMNGNIKLLQRRDETGALMDNLTYNYANNGNRLNYVTDAGNIEKGFKDSNTSGNDYSYDDNGNMISDANKDITTIDYNYLNLPKEVIFAGDKQIKYIYDASGIKHRQEVYENNTLIKATDYIGAMIMENDTLQFIQTAEGRVVPKAVDGQAKMEYQYHLKDHLGNVRTTFAVRDDDYPTDFETSSNPYFDNYDQVTKLTSALKRSGSSSHRLAGGSNETVGLMKSLYVSKGDKVKAEVYGKYIAATNQDDAINTGALITALVNMLSGGAVTGEGNVVSDNLTAGYTSAAIADNSNEQSPRAYLNYIMLDKDFNYLNSGFDRLSTSAEDPGDGSGNHQRLSFEEIAIDQDGYLIIFLSNESQQTVEVFWDDFRIDHHHNAVIQADSYYPGGGTFDSYKKEYNKENKHLYQGKEWIADGGLNWYDSEARMYDPYLWRTSVMDPHMENYFSLSPYSWAANNPLLYTDPDGKDIIIYYQDEAGKNQKFIFNGSNASDAPKNEFVQQFFKAYNTLQENGVGENVRAIAENSKTQVNLYKADRSTSEGYSIWWNPEGGSKTDQGVVMSPATVLEHESDHRNHYDLKPEEHRKLQSQKLPGWTNAEEKRVITGSELRTSRALGEIPKNGVTRTNHKGETVITYGPTSNKVNKNATYKYYKMMESKSSSSYYKRYYATQAEKYNTGN
ncbi:hypothetical protein GCM10011506_40440 [Marivirga lumbricoides]|uniref:DUF6443 domain-containing protein n=1 Tax=Marivirga lumbricoides TaxID=1046115 RepID=A0ABQ1N0E4_9BACT|nr:hypothetical protein GCM10011506_40440 [Marivirga lumbricoides]